MIIFNLLIIYPLDGYRILNEILDIYYDKEYLNYLLFIISLINIVICSIVFIFLKCYGYFIILIFLLFRTIEIYKTNKLKNKNFIFQNSFVRR